MKSIVFYGKKNLQLTDVPIPKCGDKNVLIKVMACGICGTDVHIYEGDKGAADCTPPTILGHEFAGIIEKIGKDVTNLKVGDRVTVDPNVLCDECYFCKSSLGHFCTNMTGIGTTTDGAFAQYVSVPSKQVYKLDDSVSFSEGAMTEPVSCCLHGIHLCNIKVGDTVLIIGGGMIGMIMLQLSKLSGASKIVLLEPVKSKRELAKELGATLCIDPITENPADVLAQNNISHITTVIECCGLISTLEQAIDLCGVKGTVMMFGLTKPDDELMIKPFTFFQKELTLVASYINPYTYQHALNLINNHKLDVSSMIYDHLSLEELPSLFEDPKGRSLGKYIVEPWK